MDKKELLKLIKKGESETLELKPSLSQITKSGLAEYQKINNVSRENNFKL